MRDCGFWAEPGSDEGIEGRRGGFASRGRGFGSEGKISRPSRLLDARVCARLVYLCDTLRIRVNDT